ncbi:MAG: LacI family transcriptional regulator [Opitutales bacterium]|nr:LacI family transcriptional regulator [Opitutales bacterium]NRA27688.1 LacI family DNA-binding transcriptional regulator [Opitutales bacterium]
MSRITLKSVAERVGVSKMAVSLALRGHPSISQTRREEIERVADELGYQPDGELSAAMTRLANAQKTASQGNLAILNLHDKVNSLKLWESYRRYTAGIIERAEELGFSVSEHWGRDPSISVERLSSILQARGVRGLFIFSSLANRECGGFEAIPRMGMLGMGFRPLAKHVDYVTNDQFATVRLALGAIIKMGFSRPGLVVGPNDALLEQRYSGGFKSFQSAGSKDFAEPLTGVLPGDYNVFCDWFERWSPDVILTHESFICDWLIKMDQADLPLVHLDWHPSMKEEWMGVDQQGELIGAAAVDLMLEKLRVVSDRQPRVQRAVTVSGVWRPGPQKSVLTQ